MQSECALRRNLSLLPFRPLSDQKSGRACQSSTGCFLRFYKALGECPDPAARFATVGLTAETLHLLLHWSPGLRSLKRQRYLHWRVRPVISHAHAGRSSLDGASFGLNEPTARQLRCSLRNGTNLLTGCKLQVNDLGRKLLSD